MIDLILSNSVVVAVFAVGLGWALSEFLNSSSGGQRQAIRARARSRDRR